MKFTYSIPTKILFGPGSFNDLATTPLPGKKALIVITAGKSMRANGYLDRLIDMLDKQGIGHALFDKILPNPVLRHVHEGAALAREQGCDFVIGLGGGSSIDSVSFRDFNGDGRLEVVVGWRVSMDLQALAVYSLEPDGARELMRTNYVKYAVADLNKDGKRELTVLRANQDGEGVADCYVSKNGALTLRSSVLVSMTMAELSQQGKVTVGVLRSNDSALFITGVADGARAITDVLALRGGELTNLVLSAITGVSGEVSRFCSVYPMDINGDGVTEVPRTVTLQGEDADHAVSQRVDWISYDASGTASRVLSTYHDVADGWYLQLPEGWPERVWVGRSASPDEIGITFYTDSSREESYVPVLRITALSGSERERLAVRTGRFILGRNDGVIYVGELLKGNQDWKYSVTEDEVRASFSLIGTEWSAGDN